MTSASMVLADLADRRQELEIATATAKKKLLLPLKLQGYRGELLPKRRGSSMVFFSQISKMLTL